MFSIQKSDMDLRKVLYQNIVLSGGSTLFRGFGDRLLAEIRRLAPKDMKIRVSTYIHTYTHTSPAQGHEAWGTYIHAQIHLRVQSTAHQIIHFALCAALISRALVLISYCKCKACRAVDHTYLQTQIRTYRAQDDAPMKIWVHTYILTYKNTR
jgi:hypothetical protein